MNMNFENLKVERLALGITIVSIDRPKALNALNTETLTELRKCFREIATDKTRVLIFTGTGEKAFIAGADILEMKDKSNSEGVQFAKLGHEVGKLLEIMPKPTIAAVNGYALGGGTEMACACDFIWASDNAVFGQPEVSIGVMPGFGGTFRLARYVGYPKAKELIFSGKKIDSQEAKRLGLAAQVFSAGEFRQKVLEGAQEIAKNSSTAVTAAKKAMVEFSEHVGLNSKIDGEAQLFGSLFESKDQVEGMEAFVGKRKPQFQGLEERL